MGERGEKHHRRREEQGQNRMVAWRGGDGGETTTARRRTTEDTGRRRRGHNQVSSDGDGVERREIWDGQEESDDASQGWIRENAEDLAGSETEEEGMNVGGAEGGSKTLTATP